jgi:hypothetical protein
MFGSPPRVSSVYYSGTQMHEYKSLPIHWRNQARRKGMSLWDDHTLQLQSQSYHVFIMSHQGLTRYECNGCISLRTIGIGSFVLLAWTRGPFYRGCGGTLVTSIWPQPLPLKEKCYFGRSIDQYGILRYGQVGPRPECPTCRWLCS